MNITYVPHSDNRYYFDEDLNLYGPSGLLTLPISKAGYKSVFIDRKYMPTIRSYHRAIAETFIPNPENKPCVNHINGIKTDNRVENLEWVTPSENNIHSEIMRHNNENITLSCCVSGGGYIYFKNAYEASKEIRVPVLDIWDSVKNKM